MKKICKFISDYMGALVLLSAIVALAFPEMVGHVKPTVINPLLGVIMFGMGLTLRADDFRIVFSRPKDVVIGCLAQFTVMPLLAWTLARVFQLDEALTVGVVLVGCCPGGTASNVITYLARGDVALSVGMTGVSTLLAPLLTPLLVWLLAGKTVDVNVVGMLLSILWVVILPIVAGLIVKRLWGGLIIILVVMLHNVCGLSVGYAIGSLLRMSAPKRRAVCIEVGMQNSGLASSLATLHFAAYPMATIPGAIFSVWHNISGAIVARWFAKGLTPSPGLTPDPSPTGEG